MLDAIIVGAGASGLAAARTLRGAGARVLVLEARDRIGGRVLSVHSPALALPIELGAEFVHGLAPHTLALASELRLPVVEVPAAHYVARGGRLARTDDYYDRLEAALRVLARRGPDRSVSERLRVLRSEERRRLALDYIRGFEAADPDRASATAMAHSVPTGDDRRQLRLVTGYSPLIEGLAEGTSVRLGRIVRHVDWKPGRVAIAARHGRRTERFVAKAVIVTVPIGVLRAPDDALGGIAFAPPMARARAAIRSLAMGHVVRLSLHMDASIGELVGHPDASFIHTMRRDFPAWWSPVPMRTPIVVGWVAGPPATAIDDEARELLVQRARSTLRAMGVRRPTIYGAWTHDWRHDPFARGAYAFPLVGGAHAGVALARPIDRTVFFAGEATSEDHPGTVEGALASGHRAARAVLRAIG